MTRKYTFTAIAPEEAEERGVPTDSWHMVVEDTDPEVMKATKPSNGEVVNDMIDILDGVLMGANCPGTAQWVAIRVRQALGVELDLQVRQEAEKN